MQRTPAHSSLLKCTDKFVLLASWQLGLGLKGEIIRPWLVYFENLMHNVAMAVSSWHEDKALTEQG